MSPLALSYLTTPWPHSAYFENSVYKPTEVTSAGVGGFLVTGPHVFYSETHTHGRPTPRGHHIPTQGTDRLLPAGLCVDPRGYGP